MISSKRDTDRSTEISLTDRTNITFVLPSFAGGGAERVVLTLARHLNRDRFIPALIVLNGNGPLRDLVPQDISVTDLERPRLRHAWRHLGRALQTVPSGIVLPTISHVNLAVLMQRRRMPAGTRIVARESNTPSASLQTTRWPWLMRYLYRRYFPLADAIMCPSDLVANEFATDFGLNRDRLKVLPHPVDTAAIRTAATPPIRKHGAGLRFVAAGRMTPQKGFDRLLELFATLPEDAHLTLLGEGSETGNLQQQAAQLRISARIEFAGFSTNPWRYYAGADAFLLPSRWEGMPNAALEALAVGTPVIARREAGGIAEIDPTGNAITLTASSAEFAAAMQRPAPRTDVELRESLLPDRFTLGAVMTQFETLIDTVAAGSLAPKR